MKVKEKIKLILADVDGTLLDSQKNVMPITREEIGYLHDQGILFGIASGRSPYAVRHLVHEWDIAEATDLIMGFNGAAVLDCRNGEMTSVLAMDGRALTEMQENFRDFRFNLGIYDQETYHVLFHDERSEKTALLNRFSLVVDGLKGYETQQLPKALLTAEPEELDRITEYYESMPAPVYYRMFRSAGDRSECVNPQLTKSKGIAILAEKLGLGKEEIMTFGDMMNDYEMIRDYVGVAMGNADERVKAVSRYTAPSNDEDGIGIFLREYIRKESRDE